MKWSTLKRRVIQDACSKIDRGMVDPLLLVDLLGSDFHVVRNLTSGVSSNCAIRRAYMDKVEEVINAWDIRGVGALRDIFPESFPKNLRTGNLTAYLDESLEWVVTRQQNYETHTT